MAPIQSLIYKNDRAFFYMLNRRMHCGFLTNILQCVTQLGSTTFVVVFSSIFYYYFPEQGKVLVLNLVASQALIHLLKRVINRPRPYVSIGWVIAIHPPKCTYSLPSGHSSSALTMALVLSSFFPEIMPLLMFGAFLVGLSRIYMGCHYPSDVLAGFMIALSVFLTLNEVLPFISFPFWTSL